MSETVSSLAARVEKATKPDTTEKKESTQSAPTQHEDKQKGEEEARAREYEERMEDEYAKREGGA